MPLRGDRYAGSGIILAGRRTVAEESAPLRVAAKRGVGEIGWRAEARCTELKSFGIRNEPPPQPSPGITGGGGQRGGGGGFLGAMILSLIG